MVTIEMVNNKGVRTTKKGMHMIKPSTRSGRRYIQMNMATTHTNNICSINCLYLYTYAPLRPIIL